MNASNHIFRVLILGWAIFLSACTKEKETVLVRQAPQEVQQSFAVTGNNLKIKKSSLGSVFLLIASGKSGGPTPQWIDIKPLVVSFELDASGKKMALLEESYDSVYNEIQSKNLLATFEVLKDEGDDITFAWGQGLTSFSLVSVFDIDIDEAPALDEEGSPVEADAHKDVIPVVDSYVKSLQFDDANNLEINQISRLRMTVLKSDAQKNVTLQAREETIAMNLQIRPYVAPSKEFHSKLADSDRRIGFFVTKRKKKALSAATPDNIITKWDLAVEKGPITFLVSDAVPAAYVQAVREGAEYWNHVFGREVVAVKTNVPAQASPIHRSVMLRWIPWMDSGAAYAQAQSDPLTGETLRGQIFMPSVFTRVGSVNLVITNDGNPTRQALSPTLNATTGCNVARKFNGVNQLAVEASDSQRLHLAQDAVRTTVAHEMGHALGLRHNFAGSFSARATAQEIYGAAKNYFKTPQADGLETTTSIMDYVSGIDDILSSAYIRQHALSYDKMAMTWAYAKDGAPGSDEIIDEKISKFCTDEDVDVAAAQKLQIYGCARFDAGNNPLQRKFLDAKTEKELLVKSLFTSMINRLYPAGSDKKASIESVMAATLPAWLVPTASNYSYFTPALLVDATNEGAVKSSLISFEIAKESLGTDYAGPDPELDEKLATDLKAVGGYSGILSGLLLNEAGTLDMNWAARDVAALQATPAYTQGKTLGGREYTLSAEDKAGIDKMYAAIVRLNKKSLLNSLKDALPRQVVVPTSLLKQNLILRPGVLQADEAKKLASLTIEVLRAANELKTGQVGVDLKTAISLPIKYAAAGDVTAYTALLSSSALGLAKNQENIDLVKLSITNAINNVISLAVPEAPVMASTVAAYTELLPDLVKLNRIDLPSKTWLENELSVLTVLEGTN